MEKIIKNSYGEVKVHTFIEKNEYCETDDVKGFLQGLTLLAREKKTPLKALTIKNEPNNYFYVSRNDAEEEFKNRYKDIVVFNKKRLQTIDLTGYKGYSSIQETYKHFDFMLKCIPDQVRYIEKGDRAKILDVLFPDGVDGIIADANDVLKDFEDRSYNDQIEVNGKSYAENDLFAEFNGSIFLALYEIGKIIQNCQASDIYFVNYYGTVFVYFDGIEKKSFKQLVTSIISDFNKDFNTNASFSLGEKNIKYTPVENNFTKDVFGNSIGVGDLILSPQSGDYGASWVDPIIVVDIQGDRIIPDIKHRSYYLAERCILLRSKNGVIPKYGKKDFI